MVSHWIPLHAVPILWANFIHKTPTKLFHTSMPYSTKKVSFSYMGHKHSHNIGQKPLQTPVSPTVTIESLQKLQHVRVKVNINVNSKRTSVRPAMIHYCAQVWYQLCCATRSSVTAFLTCIFGLDSKNAPLWLGSLINCGTVRIRPGNVSYIRIHTHHPR